MLGLRILAEYVLRYVCSVDGACPCSTCLLLLAALGVGRFGADLPASIVECSLQAPACWCAACHLHLHLYRAVQAPVYASDVICPTPLMLCCILLAGKYHAADHAPEPAPKGACV